MADTKERVTVHLIEILGCDRESVKDGASLVDDLGADSLDLVEIEMALEEEFSIEIETDPSPLTFDATVGDVVRVIDERLR